MNNFLWVTVYVEKTVWKSGGKNRKNRKKTYLKPERRCVHLKGPKWQQEG